MQELLAFCTPHLLRLCAKTCGPSSLKYFRTRLAAGLSDFAQAISYLSASYQPTGQQSADGIANLVRGLGEYSLTKAEKLQIVNLAPMEPVELYVVSLRLRAIELLLTGFLDCRGA